MASTPPTLGNGGQTANYTAGATTGVAVAGTMTVSPGTPDTSLTSATVQINSPLSGDTLNFTNQAGITGSYNAGTGLLTLTGSSLVANYQTALQSVTFSNTTNTSLASRTVTIQADDSAASPTTSGTITDTVNVLAPVTVSALYVKGSAWLSGFNTYLSTHTLGNVATPTLGYALQTGSLQSKDLPWTAMNTVEATFSGTVTGVSQTSLVLHGGTGGSTPSVTGFSSLGGNTYSWTLSGPLTNNRYEISFIASGITDTRGAALDGEWTTGTSTFSSSDGNGLAGGNFNFMFNATPGDVDQTTLVNATDYNKVRAKLGATSASTAYSPYLDLDGNTLINSNDYNAVRAKLGAVLPSNAPAPQVAQVGGLQTDDSLTQLALGVQEGSTSSTGTASSGVGNVVSTPVGTSVSGTSSSSGSADDDSGGGSSAASGSSSTQLASSQADDGCGGV